MHTCPVCSLPVDSHGALTHIHNTTVTHVHPECADEYRPMVDALFDQDQESESEQQR